MILTLIRHGQTVGNKEEILNGQSDDPLNVEGIQQAKDLGLRLAGTQVDCIRSSDLSRTYDSATLIAENAHRTSKISTDKRLRERSYTTYEGGSTAALAQDVKNSGLRHYQFLEQSEAIESSEQMAQRRQERFKEAIEGKGYNHVIVVAHGSFIRAIAGHLLSLSIDEYRSLFGNIENCGRVVIDVDKKQVQRFNA